MPPPHQQGQPQESAPPTNADLLSFLTRGVSSGGGGAGGSGSGGGTGGGSSEGYQQSAMPQFKQQGPSVGGPPGMQQQGPPMGQNGVPYGASMHGRGDFGSGPPAGNFPPGAQRFGR